MQTECRSYAFHLTSCRKHSHLFEANLHVTRKPQILKYFNIFLKSYMTCVSSDLVIHQTKKLAQEQFFFFFFISFEQINIGVLLHLARSGPRNSIKCHVSKACSRELPAVGVQGPRPQFTRINTIESLKNILSTVSWDFAFLCT